MTLSVIIVSFNTIKLLKKCLLDLKKEEKSLKMETIIIDNNSSDGSVNYLKKLKKEGKNLSVTYNRENLGFAKAVNQGIKKAKGKYVLLLNSDVFIKKGSLRELVKFAETNHEAGVVAPKLLNKDGTPQASCYHFPSFSGAVKEFWFGKKGSFTKYLPWAEKPVEVDAVVGAVFLIPQKVVKEVGLLDERYFMYFEDLDYCRRVKKMGYGVYYLPNVSVIHFHGQSAKKVSEQAHNWLVESSKIYHGVIGHYWVNFPIWLWQKLKRFF